MKINRIQLTNFRNHQATTIDLDHINVFSGKNAAGKSTIKAAIEYALTGRCAEWTDGAGRGAEDLLKHGAAAGGVTLDIEGLGSVSRPVKGELQVADWKGASRLQQAQLYQDLGAGADVIAAALNTSRFLKMKPDEQKNMLFSLMGLKFNLTSITAAVDDWLTRAGRTDLKSKGFFAFLEERVDCENGGPEVLDAVYKRLYAERTAAKKTLKELETLSATPAGAGQPNLPPEILAAFEDTMELARLKVQINGQLKGLKDRKEELIGLRGQVLGGQAAKDQLKRQYQQTLDAYDAAYAELSEIDFNMIELQKIEAELAKLAKEAEGARANLDLQRNLVGGHTANLETWLEAKRKLEDHERTGHRCPVAPELECTADVQAMINILTEKADAAAKLLEDARQEAAILERDAQEAAARYEEARARADEYRRYGERIEQLGRDLEAHDERKKAAMAEIEKLDALAGTSLEELESEINRLGERIAKGEELVRNIAAEERVRIERGRTAGALEKSRQEVAWLEALVEAFGPKGFKTTMLSEVIEKVQARANERLAMLSGRYGISFDVEKGFDIRVTVDGAETPLKNLSRSERLRVGIVLQDVLNGLTGLRLLVIDDCEVLDPGNKAALINLLLQVRDDYDTIIILSALGETQPRNPGIPGVSVFLVEDGAVRTIPAPAAA